MAKTKYVKLELDPIMANLVIDGLDLVQERYNQKGLYGFCEMAIALKGIMRMQNKELI